MVDPFAPIKVLVTGGSGLLGRYLKRTQPAHIQAWYTYNTCEYGAKWGMVHMDITKVDDVNQHMYELKPDVVIHTAAEGSVDRCEKDLSLGYGVNVCGTYNVIRACARLGAKFIGISSNAVFYGRNGGYDDEHDIPHPINYYGHTKLLMECSLESTKGQTALGMVEWLVFRPILLYGWPYICGRGNWATRVLDHLCNRDSRPSKLFVVDDTLTQPTYACDCAGVIWDLLDETGYINISSGDTMNLYEFAMSVAMVWGRSGESITPVDSTYFHELAPRPRDTTYNLRRLKELGLHCSDVMTGLERMKNERGSSDRIDIH